MGFFDDLKLKKDGNGNLKVTYCKNTFVTIHTERVFEIINDYATKKFIMKVSGLKVEDDTVNDQVKADAIKLSKIYITKKKKYYKRTNLKTVNEKSREFNYFIDAVKLALNLDVSFEDFVDAQAQGLEFVNTFPTEKQLSGSGAEKRVLDYLGTKNNTSKTKFTRDDYEVGSLRYKELNRCFRDELEMTLDEVQFLMDYHKQHFNLIPNSLRDYKKELEI